MAYNPWHPSLIYQLDSRKSRQSIEMTENTASDYSHNWTISTERTGSVQSRRFDWGLPYISSIRFLALWLSHSAALSSTSILLSRQSGSDQIKYCRIRLQKFELFRHRTVGIPVGLFLMYSHCVRELQSSWAIKYWYISYTILVQ